MSHFSFEERPISRASSGREPSITLNYVATGTQDEQYVHSYALAATPSIYSTIYGTLYRQDIQVEPGGFNVFYVTVPYGKHKHATGQFRLTFDTTGGTVHIKTSKETIKSYSTGSMFVPSHKQAIGVNGDNVEGTEIVIPALKLTAHFRHPQAVITLARIKALANITGTINSRPFLTFEPGEVLFLGCSGSEGTDGETEVAYQFACSANADNLTIGEIANIAKRGWDYLWISFKDDDDAGFPTKRPEFVYIERVYEEVDLAMALGFG